MIFFKEIKFLSKPVIGTAKKVVIKDLPDDYKHEGKHEISFSDKIYLLDKIKDSFMHLRNENTMYDFDFDDSSIIIRNITDLYSLECKIPVASLYKFNRYIKKEYDNSSPSLDWIEEFFNKKINLVNVKKILLPGISRSTYEIRFPSLKRAIYIPELNYFCFFEKSFNKTIDQIKCLIENDEFDAYHTNSYLALLMASVDKMNYPLLDSIYDFDYHCEHQAYVQKMSIIMKNITNFYSSIYSNIDYMSHGLIKKKVLEFLYSIGQNGKENGLITDISEINNMIIKRFMRNARSHANTKVLETHDLGNETIIYHDVLYNSLLNDISEKTIPTFAMIGRRSEFNELFDDIMKSSQSNKSVYDKIVDDFTIDKKNAFEAFLRQLEKFINQAIKDGIEYSDYLKSPIGNADNFVDFLRKIINGNFKYEETKSNKKSI